MAGKHLIHHTPYKIKVLNKQNFKRAQRSIVLRAGPSLHWRDVCQLGQVIGPGTQENTGEGPTTVTPAGLKSVRPELTPPPPDPLQCHPLAEPNRDF